MLPRNHAYAMGGRSVGGYDVMYLQRYADVVYGLTGTDPQGKPVGAVSEKTLARLPSRSLLQMLGVRHVYSYRHGGVITLRGETAVRRGWFVSRALRVRDAEEALAFMARREFAPGEVAVLEMPDADAAGLPESAGGVPHEFSTAPSGSVSVDVVELSPERLQVSVGPHGEGILVLSEIYDKGWRVRVDGRRAPLLRVDGILRGVRLPAGGTTKIELEYAPASLRIGASVSVTLLLILVLGLVVSRSRRS
jgi:hypothetical protein